MQSQQAVRLVEITRRKATELFDDILAELDAQSSRSEPIDTHNGRTDATVDDPKPAQAWTLSGALPSGDWTEIGRSRDETYRWPDGNVDRYVDVIKYRGNGGFAGMELALGYLKNGEVVGFVLSAAGGLERGLTYFFTADDFAHTNEVVSLIRGGGPNGRSGFAPHEPTPAAYRDFRIDVLRDRKAGKWNVQAVVATVDDHATMLGHTAIQARLRNLA